MLFRSKKEQSREWVANPIQNQHISGRAACIASNINKDRFDHTRLQRHRGGLLGSKKLQTYGVGEITKEMRVDFAVEVDQHRLNEIIDRQYQSNNIVYTTSRQCIEHPGEFYLVPYSPNLCAESLALYIASFDGHAEIYMIGYSNNTAGSIGDWTSQVGQVISAYKGTKFIAVGNQAHMPDNWLAQPNFEVVDYRHFISYCDV